MGIVLRGGQQRLTPISTSITPNAAVRLRGARAAFRSVFHAGAKAATVGLNGARLTWQKTKATVSFAAHRMMAIFF
ncbi:hypothetical protein C0Q88_07850 [Ralstonia pickettii]|uniref:Uncharacterized protein n=1 Tax=Ralstonia pickettii TaxID=329 RepID=A0A2N4TXZ3_RALPI|nr:hypothetical protein C0Q88_07850 [Ralstonia pickettii]